MVSLFPHPASFRFRLTTDTLAFGFLLPATGRIRVFHPLDTCAAGRTQKDCPLRADSLSSIRRQFPISNGTPPSESSHTSAHSPETRGSCGAGLRPINAQYTGMFCSCHVWLTAVRIA